ncbi:hypothetical protein SpAn4DRAFT_1285 [Sporomusa ovata]|uniref:4Fe-4S ferredoxin-type domain-containing protein n=1 Tax=Sporomusa ovata TaxID=2378 RepID=A0A0U1KSB0_9FIRM|nr:hypothetical protein SpAn4DRAFT_1285 [Sporomusa ovata]
MINSLKQLRNTAASTGFQSSLWGDIRIADSCNGCGACAEACPTAAIVITKQDDLCSISLDTSRCTQCGLCQDVCCCESIKMFSTVDLDAMLAQIPQVLIIKKQKDIDNLLEPLEQRMSRLLGYVIKN